MFGRKRATAYPSNGSVVTTRRTTRTSRPHHHQHQHTTGSSGLMSRLRPRRNTPPTYTSSAPVATTSRHSRGSTGIGFGRRKHAHGASHHHTATTVPVHSHSHSHTHTTTVPARKTSMGDKVSGAMMKLRGSLTGRPGLKGAGTRRMHGTDGRGARRYY